MCFLSTSWPPIASFLAFFPLALHFGRRMILPLLLPLCWVSPTVSLFLHRTIYCFPYFRSFLLTAESIVPPPACPPKHVFSLSPASGYLDVDASPFTVAGMEHRVLVQAAASTASPPIATSSALPAASSAKEMQLASCAVYISLFKQNATCPI